LPLIFANAWVYTIGAVLNGVGMGLFIDEIGKFITQTNDYFYPPAAPIIYAFFLLVVLLYLYIRRPSPLSARRRMYQVLHNLGEVLDHDLQPDEKLQLTTNLRQVIAEEPESNLGRLAEALIRFLEHESLYLYHRPHTFMEQAGHARQMIKRKLQQTWLPERRFRFLLVGLLGLTALWVLFGTVLFVLFVFTQGNFTVDFIQVVRTGDMTSLNILRFTFIRVLLEAGFSLLQLMAVFLLLRNRRASGVRVAILSLVMALTTVDLLVFYLDQFSASLTVLVQFGILMLVLLYRELHIKTPESQLLI
jgi:hypothetical protein